MNKQLSKRNNICRIDEINSPRSRGFRKMFSTGMSAVVLGLLCSLPVPRASAAFCLKCPTDATDTAGGSAFTIHITRQGLDQPLAEGGQVGACEILNLQ